MMDIYNALIANSFIRDKANERIKFYEYPEAEDMRETHIIIDSLGPPKPSDYADNEWLTDDYLYQIDVWSKDMAERDILANKIRDVMWVKLGFYSNGNGVDEYDKDYKIFRDARQYRGKKYIKE